MNRPGLFRALAGVALAILGMSDARGEVHLAGPNLRDGSGVEITVTALFDQVPQIGYLPVRVWIRNDSGAPRQWRMTANSGENIYPGDLNTRSQWSFDVEAGSQREYELELPLSQARGFHQTSRVDLRFQGFGVEEGSIFFGSTYYGNGPATEFIGMARSLHVADWNKLDEYCKTQSRSLCGTSLDAAFLPADWQGYAGMGSLWLTEDDWSGMETAQKNAVEEWVATGGRLFLFTKQALAEGGRESRIHGLGSINRLEPGPNGALPLPEVFREIAEDSNNRHHRIHEQYDQKWDLQARVGKQDLNAGFVICFMLAFAVLAGPVNLFVFAKGARRHFLFWTTPLLSVAGSLLLLAMILVQDGMGGSGFRRQMVILLPESRQEAVIQEQMSKTGLLLDRRFTAGGPWWIQPLDVKNNIGASASANYQQEGLKRSGDYFRNRSVQGQLLLDVRPSRARLEFVPDEDKPSVVNGLSGKIGELWLLDAQGNAWTANGIGMGEKAGLRRAEGAEMAKRLEEEALHAVGWRRYAWDRLPKDQPGMFFAFMQEGSMEALETLPDLRWAPASAIIAGTWEGFKMPVMLGKPAGAEGQAPDSTPQAEGGAP
jgi:hypothetical protein